MDDSPVEPLTMKMVMDAVRQYGHARTNEQIIKMITDHNMRPVDTITQPAAAPDVKVEYMSKEYIKLLADETHGSDTPATPIDMVLYCPSCGLQHVDEKIECICPPHCHDEACRVCIAGATPWTNPPHRSHLCHQCGHVWRPADVATNGVKAVKTVGKADSPSIPAAMGGAMSPYAQALENLLHKTELPRLTEEPLEAWAFRSLLAAITPPIPASVRDKALKEAAQLVQEKACGDDPLSPEEVVDAIRALQSKPVGTNMGYCERGQDCLCGGDLPSIREGCGNWVKFKVPEKRNVKIVAVGNSLHMSPQKTDEPTDPLDWPLPCDIKVGAGTIKKGCPLRTLVARMNVINDAMSVNTAGVSPHPLFDAWIANNQIAEKAEPLWKPEDLVIDTYRKVSGGWITKADDCVRITHKPTGVVITAEKNEDGSSYRSVHAAKAAAMLKLEETLKALRDAVHVPRFKPSGDN